MASKKTEYYLELSSAFELVLARMAKKKSDLLGEIARMQSEINTKQAKTTDTIGGWETKLKDAQAKLELLRGGPEDDSALATLKQQAETAISALSSTV